jgi:PAS domain S-box-containing protein
MDVPGNVNSEDENGSGDSTCTVQALEAEQVNLYKCLFERMNDAVVYCKILYNEKGNPVDFVVIDINLAFKRLTRYPEKIIIGRKASEFLPLLNQKHIEWMDKCCKAIMNGKKVFNEKYGPILNKWLTFNGYSPAKGYFAMIIKDVTWRKKVEEALRQGEKKYKKLANSITDPFFAVDSSLKITYWNRASETVMGLGGAEVVGRHYFEVFGRGKSTRKAAGVFLDVMRTKKPRTFTDNLPRVDKTMLFELEVYPTGNGIAVLAKDVTARKKQQLSLEVYTQRLEELVKSRTEKLKNVERLATIGETAGMIGHDIRNPLQSIIGELYLAKTELSEMPESEAKKSLLDSVGYIEEQTLYINKIVTDLQDYAKPLTPSLQTISLEDLMQRTVISLDIPGNVTVRFEVLKPFPIIKTDASFIMRILTNLVRNGIQAMEETGGELVLRAFPRENSVIIAVSDMGGGIPPEVQDRIFKPLFTTKSKGQGFGLAVVKKLTEALGGSVSFETKVGVGTTFIVELPQTPGAVGLA